MLEGCTPFPPEFAERYVRAEIWRRETIPQAIATTALQHPDSIAVADSTRSLTYSQLIAETGRLATLLSDEGITHNDRVVIQLPNCVEFATLTLACLEVGAIPVMALPAFRSAELEYLLTFSEAKAIAIAPEHRGFDHAALARRLKARLPALKSILSTSPAGGCVSMRQDGSSSRAAGSSTGDPFEVALFLLSSGTPVVPPESRNSATSNGSPVDDPAAHDELPSRHIEIHPLAGEVERIDLRTGSLALRLRASAA